MPLFEKNRRSTALTRFVEQFLECVEQSLSTLDQGEESLQRGARGEGLIRLGLLRTLGIELVPSLASRFLSATPARISASPSTPMPPSICWRDWLQNGLICCFVPVRRQNLVLIVPRNHPLAQFHTVDLSQTLPYPQVDFAKGSGLRGWWTACSPKSTAPACKPGLQYHA